jgi:hypothetical protein
VHFETETVSGPVPEGLAQSRLLENGAGGTIDHRRVDLRPDCGHRGRLGRRDRVEKPLSVPARRAHRNGPGDVRAVSVQDAAEVQHDEVTNG